MQGREVRILSPRPVSFVIIRPCNLVRHCLDWCYAVLVSPLPLRRVPRRHDVGASSLDHGHLVLRYAVVFYSAAIGSASAPGAARATSAIHPPNQPPRGPPPPARPPRHR